MSDNTVLILIIICVTAVLITVSICDTKEIVAHEQAIGQIYSTPLPSTSK